MSKIQLNGETVEVTALNLADLVVGLNLPVTKVAVERNLEIVPRSLYAQTPVMDDDRIEIVHFVGGG
jgi:thiamine biosynthesis protein ThiS